MNARKTLAVGAGAVAALLVLIQAVPYGRAHTNPPVTGEPAWDRPETRALADRACFDCHSNETVWPWYSHVAPISWAVQHHVDEGRATLNFSEWDRPQDEAHEAGEVIAEGEMPMPGYVMIHPEARLTEAEKAALQASFDAMFGGEGAAEGD